jgi:hypothetical protein
MGSLNAILRTFDTLDTIVHTSVNKSDAAESIQAQMVVAALVTLVQLMVLSRRAAVRFFFVGSSRSLRHVFLVQIRRERISNTEMRSVLRQ